MKRNNMWNTLICSLTFAVCTIPSIGDATPLPAQFNNNTPAVYQVINHVLGSTYTGNDQLEPIYVAEDGYWNNFSWWEITSSSAGFKNELGIINADGYQAVSDRVSGFQIFNAGTYAGAFMGTGTFEFGLSVNSGEPRYYGDPLHNTNDEQQDHMLTFSLGAFDYGGHSYKNGYLLAWEDLQIGASDHDYNDITFLVDANPNPVPEPATMFLFGTGLAGLVGSRLRKKKK